MHIDKNIYGTLLKFKNLNFFKKIMTRNIKNEKKMKTKNISVSKLKKLNEIKNYV